MTDLAWVLEQGDWVSYALAAVSIAMWAAVALRAHALRGLRDLGGEVSGSRGNVLARFVRDAQRLHESPQRLERLFQRAERELEFMAALIKTLVAVAPLLGLLGTVIGMVEMFGSLQGAADISEENTVAGGISKALVTTQLGLIIAAPGLFASYMLSRQQLRRERDLKALVGSFQRHSS